MPAMSSACTVSSNSPQSRGGYTLVELLLAAAIALGVMAAAATLFALFGRTASQSQATVELGDRMRSTAWRLRQDLAGATSDLRPWTEPEEDAGYFEIVEGPRTDADAAHDTDRLDADTDDILLFTTRTTGGPFVGRYGSNTLESPVAEVAWFCRPSASQPVAGTTLYDLHRRHLLVATYVGLAPFSTGNNSIPFVSWPDFYGSYDLSCRRSGGRLYPNSLGDLTKRENRFWHGLSGTTSATAFPYPLETATLDGATFIGTAREAEDVVLTNLIAFDLRVFDPEVPAKTVAGTTVYPGDPGYPSATAASPQSLGGYVDLGWAGGTVTSGTGSFPPVGKTPLGSAGIKVVNNTTAAAELTTSGTAFRTYDTWSRHYEFNGINEDGDAKTDEGTDGLDDDTDNIADDNDESETSPPYPVPLRGLEVRIRCYEPSSRQVRQVTIRHTFLSK